MDKLYDDLVALTYECVLNESTWPDLLDRLVEGTGRLHGAMVLFEGPTPGGQQITGIHCCDPKLVRDYNAYYHQYDPWSGYIPKQSPGLFHHDTQCFDAEILDKGIFHQEHLRKWGIRSISCSKLFKNHESAIYLGLDNDRDPASLPEWRNHLLQLIAPHLARAATLARKLDRLDLELQKRDLLLAQSEIPLWLVNKRSTVLFCNPAAERSQTEPAFMLRERQNRLQARDSASALPALIRTACGHNGPAGCTWPMARAANCWSRQSVPRPSSTGCSRNRWHWSPCWIIGCAHSNSLKSSSSRQPNAAWPNCSPKATHRTSAPRNWAFRSRPCAANCGPCFAKPVRNGRRNWSGCSCGPAATPEPPAQALPAPGSGRVPGNDWLRRIPRTGIPGRWGRRAAPGRSVR